MVSPFCPLLIASRSVVQERSPEVAVHSLLSRKSEVPISPFVVTVRVAACVAELHPAKHSVKARVARPPVVVRIGEAFFFMVFPVSSRCLDLPVLIDFTMHYTELGRLCLSPKQVNLRVEGLGVFPLIDWIHGTARHLHASFGRLPERAGWGNDAGD